MSEELIIKEIDDNKEEYIEFLRDIIKAKSYNPPGDEKNVALKIKDYLSRERIKCEIFPFGENRANLLAFLNDNFNYKNLLYNGHMDVVPPGNEAEWKNPPLSATIKRKKLIFGRGATDMKGPLAAMIIALKILKKLDLNLSGNLILNGVADEETGGKLGTKWSLDNKLNSIKCDFVIVGEPTGLNPFPKAIVLGEKGRIVLKIVTNGISSHASVPFIGKNAIYMMSDIIQNLTKLENYIPKIEPPLSIEELKKLMMSVFQSKEMFEKIYKEQKILPNLLKALTQYTLTLTKINGGIKDNVVPDQCEAIFDIRLLPNQSIEEILEGITKFITKLGYIVKDQPTEKPEENIVYLDVLHHSEASIWNDWKNNSTLKNLFNIIEQIYEEKPYYFVFPASSDANYYRNSNFCKKTILFGPGRGRTAHAKNEFIEIQDFINAIKVYTLFAYNFLKESND